MTPDPEGAAGRLIRSRVMQFLHAQACFAQLCTVSRDGFPVARTLGVPVNNDWSVDLVQRRVHRRLGQLERNPRVEIIWVGTPAPGSRNDQPAVFDFGWQVPRAVFLRGTVELLSEEQTLAAYELLRARLLSRGLTNAPDRSPANVKEELVGLHISPVRLRAEGFGEGAQSFSWTLEELR